mgnify:FL=1
MLQELDIELQKNVDHVTVSVIRTLDAMGRRHFVVHVPTTMFFDIGYLYIHEDGLSEGQAKARGHHHYRFVREGCDALNINMNSLSSTGLSGNVEPTSKTRRLQDVSFT